MHTSGSIQHLTGGSRGINLGAPALFTFIAASIVHSFSTFDGAVRGHETAIFLEHIAIIGGLALAAVYVAPGEQRRGSSPASILPP